MDWLPALHLSDLRHLLSQTTPADVELLKSQIEFLKDANAALADNFDRYVSTVNSSLTVAGFVLSAITILGGVVFGKSLWDFRRTLQGVTQEVERRVRQRVEQEVALVVQNRIDKLEAVLAREAIVSNVTLSYIVPAVSSMVDSGKVEFALKVLDTRGFRTFPKYLPELQASDTAAALPMFSTDVVILDLSNTTLERDGYDGVIERAIAKLPLQKAVLVVHAAGRFAAIDTATTAGHYCIPANSLVTLPARGVEAAYIADAINR